MYPNGELERLALRKAQLQLRIAVHRRQCVEAFTRLAEPVAKVDRGIAAWRRISPWAKLLAIPAGFLLQRRFGRRRATPGAGRGRLAALLAAVPLVIRGARMVMNVKSALASSRPARSSG